MNEGCLQCGQGTCPWLVSYSVGAGSLPLPLLLVCGISHRSLHPPITNHVHVTWLCTGVSLPSQLGGPGVQPCSAGHKRCPCWCEHTALPTLQGFKLETICTPCMQSPQPSVLCWLPCHMSHSRGECQFLHMSPFPNCSDSALLKPSWREGEAVQETCQLWREDMSHVCRA